MKFYELNLSEKILRALEDIGYKLSQSEIAAFLTSCYINDNSFLTKVEDIDYSDILEAISDDDYDFYKEEMER